MMEEMVYFTGPQGQQHKMCKSAVVKLKGRDPWGRELSAEDVQMLKSIGVN